MKSQALYDYELVVGPKGRQYASFRTSKGRLVKVCLSALRSVIKHFEQFPGTDIYECNLSTYVATTTINLILECTPEGRRVVGQGYVKRPSRRGPAPGWDQYVKNGAEVKSATDTALVSAFPNLAMGVCTDPVLQQNAIAVHTAGLKVTRAIMGGRGVSARSKATLDELSQLNASVFEQFQGTKDNLDDLVEDSQRRQEELNKKNKLIDTLMAETSASQELIRKMDALRTAQKD